MVWFEVVGGRVGEWVTVVVRARARVWGVRARTKTEDAIALRVL